MLSALRNIQWEFALLMAGAGVALGFVLFGLVAVAGLFRDLSPTALPTLIAVNVTMWIGTPLITMIRHYFADPRERIHWIPLLTLIVSTNSTSLLLWTMLPF